MNKLINKYQNNKVHFKKKQSRGKQVYFSRNRETARKIGWLEGRVWTGSDKRQDWRQEEKSAMSSLISHVKGF